MTEQGRGKKKIILILAGILMAAALTLLFFIFRNAVESEPEKKQEAPGKVHLFQSMPEISLTEETGKRVSPLKSGNGVSVLLVWASWCPQCRECIPQADALRKTAEENGADFFLIDRLDGEKETQEQALAFLEEYEIETKPLFDVGEEAYGKLRLRMIPTLLVLDDRLRVVSMTQGKVPSQEQLQDMIGEAQKGKAASLAEDIKRALVGEDGGMRTNYLAEGKELPSGEDVLSESQGILLEYAACAGDGELFARAWGYVQAHLTEQGLMPWVISDRTQTGVNALVDDLRIIGALETAKERGLSCGIDWDNVSAGYREAVYSCNTAEGEPVDYYDGTSGQKADRFTLCYGDLATLSRMAEKEERFQEIYDNTRNRMLNGRISEKFPLYYSYYDYTKKKYEGDRLNMAEELTLLLHLSEAGSLPEEAMDWLESQMEEKGCIYAAYDLEGSPAKDGFYESTGVYALTAMLALSEGREELAGSAADKLDQFRVTDGKEEWKGLFGNADGTGIYSFDQGMALLAYERLEEATE